MKAARLSAAAGALVLAASAVSGQADPAVRAQLEALRQADVRVATIGYRLVTSAAPLCANPTAATGLVVATASQYDGTMRPEASDLLHLGQGSAVAGVVPGSVAESAGVRAGDALIALNGRDLTMPPPRSRRADGAAYGQLVDSLHDAFAREVTKLTIERDCQTLTLRFAGAPACATNFQITLDPKLNAKADGKTVAVTGRMVDFVASDDELAFVLAHELAHNILGHRALIDAHKRTVTDTEMEADYEGVYLMAMAGYDPAAAPAFWQRMHGTRGLLWMPSGHLGDRDRIAFLQAAAAEVAAARGAPLRPDYAAFRQRNR